MERPLAIVRACVVLLCLFSLGAAAQDVQLEKYTNGVDADTAPGPSIVVGQPVNWTYVVINTGSRDLSNIVVTDDQGVTVTCPQTTLGAGLDMTCTGNGIAVAGQYANIGTVNADLPDTTPVSDTDPSHYFGIAEQLVTIETSVEGDAADSAPGPALPAGSSISFTYEVTNVTDEALLDIVVTDSVGLTVTCPSTTLAVGESMTCTASATAQPGQRLHTGSVIATGFDSENDSSDTDDAYYYGQTLSLVKRTNGIDVAAPPGPTLAPGTAVSWTYEVTNPGPATITGLSVTDDQGVTVTCGVTTLAAGESVVCTGDGTVVAGQYANIGTATATLPLGGALSTDDPSYYYGLPVAIVKSTNGFDANLAPGPAVEIGSTVNWTYEISNYGVETLSDITVTDDQGVTVTCPGNTLAPGESMTCTASDTAIAGQYANVGSVEATHPTLGTIVANDSSHYFGQNTTIDFGDAPDPTYQSLLASNGARHILGGSVYLGECVDADIDALQSAAATGDDATAGTEFGTCAVAGDDEDGVTFVTPIFTGLTNDVEVVASAPCTLSAWMDFNADGDWGEADEDLFPDGVVLVAGVNALQFDVPAGAVVGNTFARFRCTTDGAVGFTGEASDGEVEDYQVELVAPFPIVSATKVDAHHVDVDTDGNVEGGDTIRYTVTILNSGTGSAQSVVFTDTPGANTTLVAGSVVASDGTVVTGNTGGDSSVRVDIASIAAFGGSAVVTFDVTVNDPVPNGVVAVMNQGSVAGANFLTFDTDDPAGAGTSDPTITALGLQPLVGATKTVVLATDVDGDGIAEPGDTLRYVVTISNTDDGAAVGVQFTDTPDANTTLVAGSVTAVPGVVTTGNTAGDTSVVVDIASLPGNSSATITFDVTIDPIGPNVTQVVNTGTVTGTNFPTVTTDDPSQPGSADGTAIAVSPVFAAAVPTAGTWALLALMTLLGFVALRRLT